MTVDIVYKTMEDSVFFEGRRKLQITEPTFKGAIDECFLMLSEDEMASFIISANDFFTKTLETTPPAFIKEQDPMIVDIDVVDIQTEEEYFMEKEAFLNWIEDFGDYEKVILRQYIDLQKVEMSLQNQDCIILFCKRGKVKRFMLAILLRFIMRVNF